MTVFRVGMRVKKVRGFEGLGMTGKVIGFDTDNSFCDMVVKLDSVVTSRLGDVFAPGECADIFSSQWEPILEQPCDADFKESLDRLVEEIPETVR